MAEGFLGEIRMFAGNFAPRGWMLCQGQILNLRTYTALFSILGTTYGGDGQNTFALPDLRGRLPLGTGLGPGLGQTPVDPGDKDGAYTQQLNALNLPSHAVQIPGQTFPVAIPAVEGIGNASAPSTGAVLAKTNDSGGVGSVIDVYSSDPSTTTLKPFNVTTAAVNANVVGASQPFSVQNPYLGLNFIICVEGYYPSRN
ncbi:MAG: tail fiber protein [Candidatus Pseudomonas phytovorans]|uniref:Tail fiber protein n=1 Tax=Candidatus Pseudomonas phytovorans TaxID=3121377 RepID=A0AAJ6BEU4_9PSED|nr:tail fiber protein [Pseudomonas sp.]WEK32361.1 MAG: tail fiber protein [Pseudomonas sp.]